MEKKIQDGDHLQINKIAEDGTSICTIHHLDGTSDRAIGIPSKTDGEARITPCPSGDGSVFHLSPAKRGPAMVNSTKYCVEYERIFGRKRGREDQN